MNLHWTQHLIPKTQPSKPCHVCLQSLALPSLLLASLWQMPFRPCAPGGRSAHPSPQKEAHKPTNINEASRNDSRCNLHFVTCNIVQRRLRQDTSLCTAWSQTGWDQQSALEHLHHCQTALATSQNDNYQNHTLLIFLRRVEWLARMKKWITMFQGPKLLACFTHLSVHVELYDVVCLQWICMDSAFWCSYSRARLNPQTVFWCPWLKIGRLGGKGVNLSSIWYAWIDIIGVTIR